MEPYKNYSHIVTSPALQALPVCPLLIWMRLSSVQLCDTFCSLTVYSICPIRYAFVCVLSSILSHLGIV